MYIFAYFVYLFVNVFHVSIIKTLQKYDKAMVEQWIMEILKDASHREGGSLKKAKEGKERLYYIEILFIIIEIFVFIRSKPLLR